MINMRFFHCRPLAAVLFLAAASLLAMPSQATTARLHALGGGEFIEDDHNVQRWYGSLGDYANLLVLEGGHFTLPEGYHDTAGRRVSGPGVGAHLALDKAGRWGTAAVFFNGQGDDVDPGSLTRDRLRATWSAMWTRRFGDLQPTVMFRQGDDTPAASFNAGTPNQVDLNWDRSRTEYGLGLRWDLSDGAYLDLAGEIRHHREQLTMLGTFRTAYSPEVAVLAGPASTSTSSFGMRSRAFIQLGATTALVPLVEYLHEDRPLAPPAPTALRGLTGDLVKVGAGLNWYPDPDHFLVLGMDYVHAETDETATFLDGDLINQETRSWDSLSLTLGFETRFQYWLTFRGSFRYEPVDLSATDSSEPDDFASFMVNVGAAVQVGKYDLDLALSDHEPRSVAGYYGHSLSSNPGTWLTVSLRRTFP